MKAFQIIPAFALLAGLSGALSAQDFDGPSVGIQAGWTKAGARNPLTSIGPVAIDESRDSYTGGVFVGYDRELAPRVVVGVQGDFFIGDGDAIVQRTVSGSTSLNPKHGFDLTARVGYVVVPRTLAYLRGGYSNVRINTRITDLAGMRSGSSDRDGWTIGAGVERMMFRKISARVEYRFTDLSGGGGKFDRHQILIGAAYRF